MKIEQLFVKYNYDKGRSGYGIDFIIIHDTGNTQKGATAYNQYLYFNGGDRGRSAHYFVDDNEVIQIIRDEDVAWHCGTSNPPVIDGKKVLNRNTIGIEICVNEDGDYFKAVQNAITLTKMLMGKYAIPKSHVLRHYDVSKKICPQSMSGYNGQSYTWILWNWYKKQL